MDQKEGQEKERQLADADADMESRGKVMAMEEAPTEGEDPVKVGLPEEV